MHLDLQ